MYMVEEWGHTRAQVREERLIVWFREVTPQPIQKEFAQV